MIAYVPYGVITLLCVIIFLQSLIHRAERKDLYNRIMSRNLTEYKGEKPLSVRSAHDRVIRRWRGKEGEDE